MELLEYWREASGVIYQGDVLEVLKAIPDNSVDNCITSPPYWGLRDYGTATWEGGDAKCDHKLPIYEIDPKQTFEASSGSHAIRYNRSSCPKCGAVRIDNQIGLEQTPEEYVSKLTAVFEEVRRVLKKDGTLWLNLGDSYLSHPGDYRKSGGFQGKQMRENEGINSAKNISISKKFAYSCGLKNKDLVGIPWMVAFALRSAGWYLRQDIIWHKPNPMPESVRDRCTKSHEYVFLFAKSPKYYYDSDAIQEPSIGTQSKPRFGGNKYGDNNDVKFNTKSGNEYIDNGFRNKRDVWSVNVKGYKEAHFATYPEELIEPMVKTMKKDAVILDPFFGSGTTGVVAKKLGRIFIGIDLNPEYCGIAKERIEFTDYQYEIEFT